MRIKKTSARQLIFSLGVVSSFVVTAGQAAELPVPCIAGACGASTVFVQDGAATVVVSGNILNVNQQSNSAFLNWQSFNISADGVVNFHQPSSSSVAINRIHEATRPSTILGSLNANGRVYLLNRNGILFGDGARVNVGGLVASSLNITEEAINRGIAGAIQSGAPAFANTAGGEAGGILVEQGAQLTSSEGQIMLFAPEVTNRGRISTPDGQTILAAGEQVYLAASEDQFVRGLYVEVRGQGTVTNGNDSNAGRAAAEQVGRILADRGNVTLVGSVVRQQGQVSATTSTRAGGSIRLLARSADNSAVFIAEQMRTEEAANIGGELIVGPNSGTQVLLDDSDTSTAVDVTVQPRSTIQLSGRDIVIGEDSVLRAPGGEIRALATADSRRLTTSSGDGRILIAEGAVLDVAGANTSLSMDRNLLRVELRGSQLADSPLQRDGALRSEPVYVDVRETGTRDDGSVWIGTPLADLTGDVSNIRRGLAERNLNGGSISLEAGGAVAISSGATLDISGGWIDWQSGYLRTTQLLGADGRIYDIADANRDLTYTGIADAYTVTDRRWGVTRTYSLPAVGQAGRFEEGYIEGRNAGSIRINAPVSILDGNVRADVKVGEHQRRETPLSAVAVSRYDVLPRWGQLALGQADDANVVEEIRFDDTVAAPGGLRNLDEMQAVVDGAEVTLLRRGWIGENQIGELRMFAQGEVTLPGDLPLTLPGNGILNISAASIDVGSSILAPAGSIQLATIVTENTAITDRSIVVRPNVVLDVSGRWVNDDPRLNTSPDLSPLLIDGGQVSLRALDGGLTLSEGSLIDVSAGAWRTVSGEVEGGRGGSIAVGVDVQSAAEISPLELGGELRAHALKRGGSLTLRAPAMCIGSGECVSDDALILDPASLMSSGFESIQLETSAGDLVLTSGTQWVLQQQNLALTEDSLNAVSGTDLSQFTQLTTLPDFERRASNLTLSALGGVVGSQERRANLLLEEGSALLGDPLATIALSTRSSALLDGVVRAPGGRIDIGVSGSASFISRFDQGLWIGERAVLDVSGTSVFAPSDQNLRLGSVYSGGVIRVDARNGFVMAAQGSRLSASGTSTELDVRSADDRYVRQNISTTGGTISIAAADGIQLNGTLEAHSGAPGATRGGHLEIALDPNRQVLRDRLDPLQGDRVIAIHDQLSPTSVQFGSSLPTSRVGIADLSAEMIASGGFDSLTLRAHNFSLDTSPAGGGTPVLVGIGRVELDSGARLTVPGYLQINAASIGVSGAGAEASIAASYVGIDRSLGSTPDALTLSAPAARVGDGSLLIEANFIDINGSVTLDRVAQATLRSTGDIRGRGVLLPDNRFVGGLSTAGDLVLEAQQIYPTTLSEFTIAAENIRVAQVDGTPDVVLSAGGILNLQANTIEIAGTVRAPLGQINIAAERIDVLAGGNLSTSLGGADVLFGNTQGGLDWTYQYNTERTRVFNADQEALPQQRVTLDGSTINLAQGSSIDLSGGGDLLAWEFIQGPGGSIDRLAASANPNQFAILPEQALSFAPFDPIASAGSTLRPGETIWLSGGAGVPEGSYVLLPARYALLPGAFLVEAVAGYDDLASGVAYDVSAGGKIVAGRRGIAGTSLTDGRTSGYRVRSGTAALSESRYDLVRASEFFADEERAGQMALPRDAGSLTLLADTTLSIESTLRANAATGGRGGSVEIAAEALSIVNDSSSAPSGSVALDAEQLSSLNAQSLLLGGRRVRTADGDRIEVLSSAVTVESGAHLTGPEVTLVASDALRVDSDASVVAQGSSFVSAETLILDEGSSMLRVSVADQVEVERTGSAVGSGLLQLASGSTVGAPGSITLDIGGVAETNGRFEVGSGSLAIGANSIGLGVADQSYTGVTIGSAVLSSLGDGSLELRARNGLDLFAGVDLRTRDLTIDAPVIRSLVDGSQSRISTDRLALSGSDSAVSGVGPGSSFLELASQTVEFLGGHLLLDNFDAVSLVANAQLNAAETGQLSAANDLSITSALITGDSGSDFHVHAGGDLRFARVEGQTPAQVDSLGARLEFSAQSISGGLSARANAGDVLLRSAGNIQLDGTTNIDVSGRRVQFGDVGVDASGGRILLGSQIGSVDVASGAQLDVSSGTAADAGTLELVVPEGSVALNASLIGAGRSGVGSSVDIVARSLDFAQLQTILSAAGFNGDWSIQQRGAGDFVVGAGQTIQARSVSLTADAGAIRVDGTIDSTSARGGRVALAASGSIGVSGNILARGLDENIRGGHIELTSSTGISLAATSRLDVSGTTLSDPALVPGGTVILRAPRSAYLSVLDPAATPLMRTAGQIAGARDISLEAVERYELADGVVSDTSTGSVWYTDAATFMDRAADITSALGLGSVAVAQVRPGIELVATESDLNPTGALTLLSAWNLREWRFGPDADVAGVLTLRAAGDLNIEQSINDGFADQYTFRLTDTGESWSYRLTAGADLGSTSTAAVRRHVDDEQAIGSVNVAAGSTGDQRFIRTGTGTINVNAAADLVLASEASLIYTAGVAGPGVILNDSPYILGGLDGNAYPIGGGDIRIDVGRDINSAPARQLYAEWLMRAGGLLEPLPTSVGWTVAFDRFEQGVAALGGGSVDVSAGRDVVNLSLSTPSIGRQVGGIDPEHSQVQVVGTGDLRLQLNGDLRGGQFFVGNGAGVLDVGGSIDIDARGVETVIAQGRGDMSIAARQDLIIGAVVNPTLLPAMYPDYGQATSGISVYGTYDATTRVSARSIAGDLRIGLPAGDSPPLLNELPNYPQFAQNATNPLNLLPPVVELAALSGSLATEGQLQLWSSPVGNLTLVAAQDVATSRIIMSDAELGTTLPTPRSPGSDLAPLVLNFGTVGFNAPRPIHGEGEGDREPSRIIARDGSVIGENAGTALVYIPEQVEVSAGEDISNLNLQIQHFATDNVSSVSAGRDVVYTSDRDPTSGLLAANNTSMTIDGPGRLEVHAGRNVDLQTSEQGITSYGDTRNPALWDVGADVSVLAGLNSREPAYDQFTTDYLERIATYDELLIEYVTAQLGTAPGNKAAALTSFRQLSRARQRELLETVLFAELRAGGRLAAAPGEDSGDFTRAFTALETYFPGANPDLEAGETNPYEGDINLFFSRIYTIDGGDISLMAPGGEINAGLAVLPASFGVVKDASQLGVVAQSTGNVSALSFNDLQVNESRVFAADGGDILVWATQGDIDAGRGAKTAISAPPPRITIDADGKVSVIFSAALSGSGIQTLATSRDREPGDVDLFAPRGVVNAGDAGIVAGNLTIAATAVLGADNIQVSGTAVGVPVETSGIGVSLAGASAVAGSASSAATDIVADDPEGGEQVNLADAALSWLEVFVVGLGEDTCRQDDLECLKRQSTE